MRLPVPRRRAPRRFRPLRFELFEHRTLLAGEFGGAFAFGSDNGAGSTIGKKVATDGDGNIFLAGVFSGTVDFDDGPGSLTLTSAGSLDGYVAKYSSGGALLWVKSWGGPDNEKVYGLAVDSGGSVLIAGEFRRTADFDPGPGRADRTSQGLTDSYVLKLDGAGNFGFANTWGNANDDNALSVGVDAAGNVYVLSNFKGRVDFDPGPITVMPPETLGASEVALSRFDPSGVHTRLSLIRSSNLAFGFSLAVGSAGEVAFSGTFIGTVDLDPGAGVAERTTADFAYRTFVVRLDPQGDFVYGVVTAEPNTYLQFGLALDAAGSVYVAGKFPGQMDIDLGPGTTLRTAVGSYDAVVLKLNSTGGLALAATFGGTGETAASAVAVTPTGQILVTGRFRNNVDFDPGPGTFILNSAQWGANSVFVARLSSTGDLVQAVAMENSSLVEELALATDGAGNAIVSGRFTSQLDLDPGAGQNLRSSVGWEDAFVVKVSTSGAGLFAHTFGSPYSGSDEGHAIAVDAAGNVYVAGLFSKTVDFDLGPGEFQLTATGGANSKPDVFIAKYGPQRELIWARGFGGLEQEWVTSLAFDASGNLYLAGGIYGSADLDPGPGEFLRGGGFEQNTFLVKLSATGNFVGATTISGGGVGELALDSAGNVYLTGSFFGTVDFDPGPGVVLRTASSNADSYVVKYSPSLSFAFVATWGGSNEVRTGGLALDQSGNIYVAGNFQGTIDFDSGPGLQQRTSAGETDGFVSKFDPNGNWVYTSVFAGVDWTVNEDLVVDAAGAVYIVGEMSGTVDFDPGPGSVLRSATGFRDQFIAKLDAAGQFSWAHVLQAMGAPASILLDNSGYIYFTGSNYSATDFDPGAGVQTRASGAYVARWTTDGQFSYVQVIDTQPSPGLVAGITSIWNSTLDAAGNLWLTGSFSGEVDFDPGSSRNAEFISGVNVGDAFVVRLFNQPTGSLSAEFDGFGNLVIADPFGKNNGLTIEVIATTVSITDAVEQFYMTPPGGTLSNNDRTLTVPLSHVAGALIIDALNGTDTFLVTNLGDLKALTLNGGAGEDKFGSTTQRLTPSWQTRVRLDGGPAGDQVFLDMSILGATTAAIMHDAGTLAAKGYAPFTGLNISNLNVLTIQGVLTPIPGSVVVQGTVRNDFATIVSRRASNLFDEYFVRVNQLRAMAKSANQFIFIGGDGNDLATVQFVPTASQMFGNGGDDFLIGGDSMDIIDGGDGNDRLLGRDGDDYLNAGGGDSNYVAGDAGNDRLHGGAGQDTLLGGDGDDAIDGRAGDDDLVGGDGHDLVIGGVGIDLIQGNAGNDLLVGHATDHAGSTTVYDQYDSDLEAILASWIESQPAGFLSIYLVPDEPAADALFGGLGDDDFYVGATDLTPDFQATGLGSDRRY